MDNNHEFEELLNMRSVPPMRSNLEHRIIQASLEQGAKVRRGASILASILDNLLLPRPAMSMAVVLILGLSTGLYSAGSAQLMDSDLDAFLLDYSEIEYGEFL